MDFSLNGVASLYQTTGQDASAKKMEDSLKSDFSNTSDEELMDVCKQFESYFVEQMLKAMRKTIPQTEMTSQASQSMKEYFEDSLYQEYAKSMTANDGVGLAKMLYEQMKRNYSL